MNPLKRLAILCTVGPTLLLACTGHRAEAQPPMEMVDPHVILAADDARIKAMTTRDRGAMERIFDDDLHYAHSSGSIDTKQSLVDLITSGKLTYVEYEPLDRRVRFPGKGIALVTGRARVVAENEKGRHELTLSYLSVWREVGGTWKFLAWQSARLPPPNP